jgi:hypothetical protein
MRPVILLFTLLFIFSCQSVQVKQDENEYQIIGLCCGECIGSCFRGFFISHEVVYRIKGKYCDNFDTLNKQPVDKSLSDKVKLVLNELPSQLEKYHGKIGCPDCHDQCGIYLSFGNNNKYQQVIIDPDIDKHPDELKRFVQKVQELKLL